MIKPDTPILFHSYDYWCIDIWVGIHVLLCNLILLLCNNVMANCVEFNSHTNSEITF